MTTKNGCETKEPPCLPLVVLQEQRTNDKGDIDSLIKTVFGNGDKGLKLHVAENTQDIRAMKSELAEIKDCMKANGKEKALIVVAIIGAIASILTTLINLAVK